MSIEGESIIKGAFEALEFAQGKESGLHQLKNRAFQNTKVLQEYEALSEEFDVGSEAQRNEKLL
jgi:hypothetical protein